MFSVNELFVILFILSFAGTVMCYVSRFSDDEASSGRLTRPQALLTRLNRSSGVCPKSLLNPPDLIPMSSPQEPDMSETYYNREPLGAELIRETFGSSQLLEDEMPVYWNDRALNGAFTCSLLGSKYCIPYKLDNRIKSGKKIRGYYFGNLFMTAVRLFYEDTRILWVNFDPTIHSHYVNVVMNTIPECYSHLGYQEESKNLDGTTFQTIYLSGHHSPPGCWSASSIFHHLMHVLGFKHMHQHPDRDTYLHVNVSNVEAGNQGNYIVSSRATWPPSQNFSRYSVLMYASNQFQSKRAKHLEQVAKHHRQTYSVFWPLQRKYEGRLFPNKGFIDRMNEPSDADLRTINGQYQYTFGINPRHRLKRFL